MIESEDYGELPEDLEMSFTSDAIDILKTFSPHQVGHRPNDWIKRDLLLGGALTQKQNRLFRKLLKVRPFDLFGHIPKEMAKQRQIVEQGLAFDFLHRMHLLTIHSELSESFWIDEKISRLLRCPPSFWLIKTAEGSRIRDCGDAWACPYCYTRKMAACVRLLESTTNTSNCCFMVLLEAFQDIGREDIRSVRAQMKTLRLSMIGLARRYGASGGIWSTQLFPDQSLGHHLGEDVLWSCASRPISQHRIAVAAAIPPTAGSISALEPLIQGDICLDSQLEVEAAPVAVDVLPFTGRSTIRAISVQSYPSSFPREQLKNCRFGLFVWPPIACLNGLGWQSRSQLMRNLKVYSRWGEFRKGGRPFVSPLPVASHANSSQEARRELLLDSALTLLKTSSMLSPKSHGRKKLRQLLQDQGHSVSERDARWLVQRLKND